MALTRIIETIDVDCDGISHAFHRVSLPSNVVGNEQTALTYAIKSDQISGYNDVVGAVFTLSEFYDRYGEKMDDHDRDYFLREGYWSITYYRPGI